MTGTERARAGGLLALALALAVAAPARAADVRDPQYEARKSIFARAVRPLPEGPRVPNPPQGEHFLSQQQWGGRTTEHENETVAAEKAVADLAATRDTRVFEDLARSLVVFSRAIPVTQAALQKATEKYEQTNLPKVESDEAEFRRTGKAPTTIRIDLGVALDKLSWDRAEAAHAYDFSVRVRDALVAGMGENLALLGEARGEVWKAVLALGGEGKSPLERLAFCEALRGVPDPETDVHLLALEAREKDPFVLCVVLETLAERGAPAALPRLIARLNDAETTVAVTAIHGLARFRSPEVIPALLARFQKVEGRIYSDLAETLFAITGKHNADEVSSWSFWWKNEGEKFLRRWSPDVSVRLEEVDAISDADENAIDIPAELAALLPTEKDPKVRDAILDGLAAHRSDFARITLIRCLTDANRNTRLAAIRGLAHYRHVSVPEELVRIVPRADKEELQAIFQSLKTLWGGPTEFTVESAEREPILRWWSASKPRVPEQFFKLGARNLASGRTQDAGGDRWKDRLFYGLKVDSDRVIFVVDCSLSMEEPAKKPAPGTPGTSTPKEGTGAGGAAGTKDGAAKVQRKIDVAQAELKRVLRSLPEGTEFGMIFFSIKADVWDQGLVVMGPETRKRALAWVDTLKTHFATNIYDAMELAFNVGTPRSTLRATGIADTIFLVSDGAPTAGKFLKPDIIRDFVKRWNKGRNTKVHVVGVGDDHDVVFCRNLAEENGGYYVAR